MVLSLLKCTIPDLIQDVTHQGSILKETECVAVTHAIFRALGRRLQQGQGFNSEYLTVREGRLNQTLVVA